MEQITQLTWTGPDAATASQLTRVEAQQWNQPVGVGAYFGRDNQHHVIVGMSNGFLRELHGATDALLHDDLGYVVGIRPIIDAYNDPSGYQHAIAATNDGNVHELWWRTPVRIIGEPMPQPVGALG